MTTLAARRRLVAALVVVVLSIVGAACGGGSGSPTSASAPEPAVQHHQVSAGGLTRTYRLYVPLSLDRGRPAPLVLILAGVGNTGESMVEATGFDRIGDRDGVVVAYPEGENQTWNAGYCCLGRAGSGPDDVDFLSRLIDDVASKQNIDRARVFAVGVSAGGMMAYRLGCDAAARIAGIGSVAGAMVLDDCHPARPVSVIEVHGTDDGLVPYLGGATAGGATQPSPPTADVVGRWASVDGCPAPSTQSSGPVSTSSWSGCREGTAVKLITVQGGGHTWFAPGLGQIAGAVDATAEIWTFLNATHRDG